MKNKTRKFKLRNATRHFKRERHQKDMKKIITKFGGGLSWGWFMFKLKLTEQINKNKKRSKKVKKTNKPSKIIEVKVEESEISIEK